VPALPNWELLELQYHFIHSFHSILQALTHSLTHSLYYHPSIDNVRVNSSSTHHHEVVLHYTTRQHNHRQSDRQYTRIRRSSSPAKLKSPVPPKTKMGLRALRAVSKSQNGVGAFILQCKKMEFNYCEHGGSSRGMM